MKVTGYFRISDKKQDGNYSIEAQRFEFQKFAQANGAEITGEFVEVESGRRKSRPQLQAALKLAKKTKSTLVVVRLDRLARNVHFISGLMESGVEFKALDLPQADKFTLHIFAALAERASEDTSIRTKMGMAEARRQGKTFGRNGKVLAEKHKAQANVYAESLRPKVTSIIAGSRKLTYEKLAVKMNKQGITGRNGGKFYAGSARNLVKRLALSL
jgi:DNA invertase Pin-like site-specific DNA recombinase